MNGVGVIQTDRATVLLLSIEAYATALGRAIYIQTLTGSPMQLEIFFDWSAMLSITLEALIGCYCITVSHLFLLSSPPS
jgi:hypothetical protein